MNIALRRKIMNEPSVNVFSSTAFPEDKDRNICSSKFHDHGIKCENGGLLAGDESGH